MKRWEDELLLLMDCCEVDVLLEDLFFRRLDEERVIRSVVEGFNVILYIDMYSCILLHPLPSGGSATLGLVTQYPILVSCIIISSE